MKTVHVNGVNIRYLEKGAGSETVVFSHGFLMSHKMFEHQIEDLSQYYRIIAFDHRCHGPSEDVTNDFDIYDLVGDTIALFKKCE